MPVISGAIIAAIITAVVGNALVQRWQQRNWLAQQRQLARKEEFDQLQKLFDELSAAANARLFSLRSFLRSLASEEMVFEKRKSSYQKDIANWNKLLSSFYVRLTLFLSRDLTYRLESDVHARFRKATQHTEALYEKRKRRAEPLLKSQTAVVESQINELQGKIQIFLEDVLGYLVEKRREVIEGSRVFYNPNNLWEFTNLQLIGLLFCSDVDRAYIVRPA